MNVGDLVMQNYTIQALRPAAVSVRDFGMAEALRKSHHVLEATWVSEDGNTFRAKQKFKGILPILNTNHEDEFPTELFTVVATPEEYMAFLMMGLGR